jgi:methyl-accepting chemotaxis protein
MAKHAARNSMPKNLRQQANRHALISVFLFAVLIGTVSFDYIRASSDLQGQQVLQREQVALARFGAMLPGMLAPIDDFMLSGDGKDKASQGQPFVSFQRAYSGVSALSGISIDQRVQLKQVFDLMQRVQDITASIRDDQGTHSRDLALVARSLVTVAQAKVDRVAQALADVQRRQGQGIQNRMSMLAGINLAVIVVLLFAVIMLMRGLARGVTRSLAEIASDVGSASGAMLEATEQQVQDADTQGLSLAEVTRELEQMSVASGKIAATASSVERLAEAMVGSAVQAGKDVGEAAVLLQGIREAVRVIAERGQASRQKAERIMESLASVQEIADETHLLALNASIESAAAGEHGKRFAVVAAEVRRLAERVREFTEEIEGVASEVNAAASASTSVAQSGLAEVDKGIEVAQRVHEAVAQIQGMSSKTSQAVRAIAQATGRQDKTSQAFLEGMRQMARLLHDSAQQLQDSREISQRLMGAAENLQRLL